MSTALVHRAEFRGGARELFAFRGDEVVLSGPAGTGKSRAALTKVHLMCLATPGVRALIVRKTARSLTSTTLVTYAEKVAAEAITSGTVHWYGGSQKEAAAWRYDNGSVIVVGGLDVPDKVLSSEYDVIFVDECTEIDERAWNTLSSRLRNGRLSFAQLIGSCNPGPPTHWILVRARTTLKLLHSTHKDNPAYYKANGETTMAGFEYLRRLDALTGIQRARLLDGRWAAAEGLVYEGFQHAVHVIPRFEIPEDWPRILAVDFGFIHPFCAQWWARDPDGRLFLYREILRTKRLVEDHARDMRTAMMILDGEGGERWGEPVPTVICDHDAEDRATLERHLKLPTRPAKKTVSDGIQAVAARFRLAGDGRARIFLLEGSLIERDRELANAGAPTCLHEEIAAYIWSDKQTKEQPVKDRDDACDTMRYAVAHVDLQGRARADRVW